MALYQRATPARAAVVRGFVAENYGSRGFTARDADGNVWSFGAYGGE